MVTVSQVKAAAPIATHLDAVQSLLSSLQSAVSGGYTLAAGPIDCHDSKGNTIRINLPELDAATTAALFNAAIAQVQSVAQSLSTQLSAI